VNPVQKLLWFFVFLAGLATAAAGVRVLTDPPQPLPTLGDSGQAPGSVRVAWIDHAGCTGACAETRDFLEAMKRAAPSSIVILQASQEDVELLYALAGPPKPDPDSNEIVLPLWGDIGEWSLTAEDGKPFGSADLKDKIWISDFIFTRCGSACPAMCEGMESVIAKLPNDPRLRFVSFSVDPEYDKPEVLREYKAKWKGDPERWRFVTGTWVYKLAYEGFKVNEARPNPNPTAGDEFFHSQRFTLVDGKGRMRGLYQYDYDLPESRPVTEEAIARDAKALLETPEKVVDHVHDRRLFLVDKEGRLRGVYGPDKAGALGRDARRLALTPEKLASIRSLPALNAALNFTSFLFLSAGLAFILNRKITLHKVAMTTALITSLVFLASYVTYHVQAGSVKYAGEGWMRSAYFGILVSHTVLAAAVAPLALVTVIRAWRGTFDRHVAIARWTLPVWMYVSLTGILVYLMLYRLS
jgi:uncharacterized membrane protein YozB (DUF420 family)/cytochrome oxidase Cu insertion factor (SCO1/SenC/PrrC family)